MKTMLTALALAATLAQPAAAITFSKLTTIYIGSGVYDSGDISGSGIATAIHCSNVSGVSTEVRVLILTPLGATSGSLTRTVPHGATQTFVTHQTAWLTDAGGDLSTFASDPSGVVNVESRQSAVFCTAAIVDAANYPPLFTMPLHLVRVNPHPGTVE